MKSHAKKILVFMAVGTLASCTTYSRRQCESFNWHELGRKSALQGDRPEEGLPHYDRHCAQEHGINPNRDEFLMGFDQGIKELCSEDGGLKLGQSGHLYKGTCPSTSEAAFVKTFEKGRFVYLEKKVIDLEKKVQSLKSDLADKEREIDSLESELSSLKSRNCVD